MPLEREFEFYLAHAEDFAKKFSGRFVVIKNQKVIGDYGTEDQAIKAAAKKFELGTFLVQQCGGPETYTQTFHSRVATR